MTGMASPVICLPAAAPPRFDLAVQLLLQFPAARLSLGDLRSPATVDGGKYDPVADSNLWGDMASELQLDLSPVTINDKVLKLLDAFEHWLAHSEHACTKNDPKDLARWGLIKSNAFAVAQIASSSKIPNIKLWFKEVQSWEMARKLVNQMGTLQAKKNNATALPLDAMLQNVVPGKLTVRFAPEPSGYLHIGHVKAAVLNRYFADKYDGRFLLRFDNTNPSREEGEFEDAIKEDLGMLDIAFDAVVHASDHFDAVIEHARRLIKQGDAYMDDTEAETVKEQRRALVPSKNRDAAMTTNLEHFEEMLSGSLEGQRWSLRAKIDYTHKNGAMRDPVIFRCMVDVPHYVTGTKYKAYPMYDLACPIIDHLDGVTHVLRSNEYAARHEQYEWFVVRLGFGNVEIFDFSRVDFVYTVLSKRKIKRLVERGVVEGWEDPRVATVRGMRARGMTVQGLKEYIVSQGASQQNMLLEWDKIWTGNKRVIDPVAPRHWALAEEDIVTATILGGPETPYEGVKPLHKKNPAVGTKRVTYSSTILLEQADAASFAVNEEITLMDWGNAFVSAIQRQNDRVVSLELTLNLEGDFKKTSKKVTWLSASVEPTPVVLVEYDYLIRKKKLDDDDDFDAVTNPITERRVNAVASPQVAGLGKWDIIQFERKGFYISQGKRDGEGRMQFGFIPDGRQQTVALKGEPWPTDTVKIKGKR